MMKADQDAARRLRELLDRPMPKREELGAEGYFDPWDAFNGALTTYNAEIDWMAIQTLEAVRDGKTFDLLVGRHSLFVEFFLQLLSGHFYTEYGTSPRGSWPTHGGTDALIDEWIEKWKAWYQVNWGNLP